MQLGERENAMADYSRAIELDPNHAHHYSVRGAAYMQLAEWEKAVADFYKTKELNPDNSSAWQRLGWAHYRTGDWQASIDSLEKSIELQGNGGNPWQWFFLAMAHWQLGEEDEARRWYDKSVEWMEKEKSDNEELHHLRSEAAELLGINESPPEEKEKPSTEN